MPFMDHLGVLRKHLLRAVIWFMLGAIGAFLSLDTVWDWMLVPLCKAQPKCAVYPRELLEPFFVYIKLGCLLAFFYSLPLLLFEAWSFVSPGLYKREKRVLV